MSKQEDSRSFMQELDQWSEAIVVSPLFSIDPNEDEGEKGPSRR